MAERPPNVTPAEFRAAAVATLAAAVLLSDMVMAPYPSPDVCLAVAAVAVLVCLVAAACFALLRWKRGAL